MSIFNSLLEPQQYLLIPAMPTPNGRLHLGHMAGPFLKMDMLARTFRRSGHLADVMSASDVYESYVLRKAHQTGLSVEAVCEQYHALIKEDMEALMLDCTAYFNPLTRAYREKTDFYYRDTLEALVESGTAYQRAEKVLYSPEADKYIVGTWLQGDCPHCGSGAGSYLCEACGMQFNPEDVVNPSSTTGETDLEETEVDTLFLKVKEENLLMERIRQMGIREEMVDVVKQYMHHYDGEVRLTNPGNWGTQWTDEQLRGSNYHVVFPYSGLFSLSRICGEILADKYSLDKNPFDQGSSVTTIASFGIDSTIPWFVGVLGANLAADRFKPFDYFLTNYFY
ncbi:MAG: class I tRNA ligase family protein, partial [Bacteroidota bacterium]